MSGIIDTEVECPNCGADDAFFQTDATRGDGTWSEFYNCTNSCKHQMWYIYEENDVWHPPMNKPGKYILKPGETVAKPWNDNQS